MYVCVCGNIEHYIYIHAECFLRKCKIFTSKLKRLNLLTNYFHKRF